MASRAECQNVDRFFSIEEQPEVIASQLNDFSAHLANGPLVDTLDFYDHDAGDGPAEDGKLQTCGFPACAASADTERNCARILQDMLRKCLAAAPAPSVVQRIRIFEDTTISHEVGAGVFATFSECRSRQFRRLRAANGLSEEQYVDALCARPLLGQSGQGGKSGALFLISHDERYILKTIEEHEYTCLKEILPQYVFYIEENRESLLCRIFGAYSLTVEGTTLRVVVMANMLQGPQKFIYDLKGTTEDRWVDPTRNKVLKDDNFIGQTMLFSDDQARALHGYILEDAEFLESLGLMDYSLLLGISAPASGAAVTNGLPALAAGGDHASTASPGLRGSLRAEAPGKPATVTPQHFQLCIIDYLQRWTPKKVAAHWLKKCTIGCTHEIDTEPPTVYCARFYKYFTTKIQSAP